MQEIKNVSIFKCDFCGKKYFRKSDTSRHEKWCFKNPANDHACFKNCNHLVREEMEVEQNCTNDRGIRKTFTCALTQQKMFSYIAEKRRLDVIYEADTIRMPLECDKYQEKTDDEIWEGTFGELPPF